MKRYEEAEGVVSISGPGPRQGCRFATPRGSWSKFHFAKVHLMVPVLMLSKQPSIVHHPLPRRTVPSRRCPFHVQPLGASSPPPLTISRAPSGQAALAPAQLWVTGLPVDPHPAPPVADVAPASRWTAENTSQGVHCGKPPAPPQVGSHGLDELKRAKEPMNHPQQVASPKAP